MSASDVIEVCSRHSCEGEAVTDPCIVCIGTGDPDTGLPCICGGAGTASAERDGLRDELSSLVADRIVAIARAEKAEAAAAEMREALRVRIEHGVTVSIDAAHRRLLASSDVGVGLLAERDALKAEAHVQHCAQDELLRQLFSAEQRNAVQAARIKELEAQTLLTPAEVTAVREAIHAGAPREDTVGALIMIGALRILDNEGVVRLAEKLDAPSSVHAGRKYDLECLFCSNECSLPSDPYTLRAALHIQHHVQDKSLRLRELEVELEAANALNSHLLDARNALVAQRDAAISANNSTIRIKSEIISSLHLTADAQAVRIRELEDLLKASCGDHVAESCEYADYKGNACTCGAEEWNTRVAAALAKVKP